MPDYATLGGIVSAAAIAATWTTLWFALLLTGRFTTRLVLSVPARPLPACWCGLGLYLTFVHAWHLVLPATAWAWLPLVVVSVVELVQSRLEVWQGLRGARAAAQPAQQQVLLGGTLLLVLWLGNAAIGPIVSYDSGLYHLQAVRWAHTYPVVPGLANLHERLGFTSSWWPYVGSLAVGPWSGRTSHLAMGSVFGLLLVEQWKCCVYVVFRRTVRADLLIGAILLPVSLRQITLGHLASPAYDEVAYALVVVAALYALRALRGGAVDAAVAVVVAAAAASVRLQYAPFVVLLVPLVVITAVRTASITRRQAAALVAVPTVAALVFVATNLVTSGYPFFPLTTLGLPVDWRVPHSTADPLQPAIRDFARLIGAGTTSGWSWLGQWADRNLHQWRFASAVLLLGVGLVLLAIATLRRRSGSAAAIRRQSPLVIVLSAASVNIVWWFITAPDPRFALGVIWVAAAGTFAGGVLAIRAPRIRVAAVATTFLALAVPAVTGLHQKLLFSVWPSTFINHRLDLTDRRVTSTTLITTPTATYRVPVFRDQCWSVPLPCAPGVVPGLEERGPTLRSGYRIAR